MTPVSGTNNIDEQAIGLIEKPPDLDHFTGNAFQALLRPEVLCIVACHLRGREMDLVYRLIRNTKNLVTYPVCMSRSKVMLFVGIMGHVDRPWTVNRLDIQPLSQHAQHHSNTLRLAIAFAISSSPPL